LDLRREPVSPSLITSGIPPTGVASAGAQVRKGNAESEKTMKT